MERHMKHGMQGATSGGCCHIGTMAKIETVYAGENSAWSLSGCYCLTRNRRLQPIGDQLNVAPSTHRSARLDGERR